MNMIKKKRTLFQRNKRGQKSIRQNMNSSKKKVAMKKEMKKMKRNNQLNLQRKNKKILKLKKGKKDHLEHLEVEDQEEATIKEAIEDQKVDIEVKVDTEVEEAPEVEAIISKQILKPTNHREVLEEVVIKKEVAIKREEVIKIEVVTEESHTIRETNKMITIDLIDMKESHMALEKKIKIRNQFLRKILPQVALNLLVRDLRRSTLQGSPPAKVEGQDQHKEPSEEVVKVEVVSEETTEVVVVDNNSNNEPYRI